jgi:hypothetical protein
MMIFDGFPIEAKAHEFAEHVKNVFGREAIVCLTEEEAREHDLFPFDINPPVVMVDRDGTNFGPEKDIIEAARLLFGGEFAGT